MFSGGEIRIINVFWTKNDKIQQANRAQYCSTVEYCSTVQYHNRTLYAVYIPTVVVSVEKRIQYTVHYCINLLLVRLLSVVDVSCQLSKKLGVLKLFTVCSLVEAPLRVDLSWDFFSRDRVMHPTSDLKDPGWLCKDGTTSTLCRSTQPKVKTKWLPTIYQSWYGTRVTIIANSAKGVQDLNYLLIVKIYFGH